MTKIILIILCVLIFIGMLALDIIISRSMNRKDEEDDDTSKGSGK